MINVILEHLDVLFDRDTAARWRMILTSAGCIAVIGFAAQRFGLSFVDARSLATITGGTIFLAQILFYVLPKPQLQFDRPKFSKRTYIRYAASLAATGLQAIIALVSAPAVEAAILNRRFREAVFSAAPPEEKAHIIGRVMADAVKVNATVEGSLVTQAEQDVLSLLKACPSESTVFAVGQILAYRASLSRGELLSDAGHLYYLARTAMETLPLFLPVKPRSADSKIYAAVDVSDKCIIGGASISSIAGRAKMGGLPSPVLGGSVVALVDKYEISFDNLDIRNIVFKDSRIIYHGGPLVLENVSFLNCDLEFPSDSISESVRTLKRLIVSSNAVKFRNS